MLLEAACSHKIDLSASWMIGDSDHDVEAGKNAGCRTVRLLRSNEAGNRHADVIARSLLEATYKILERENITADGVARSATHESSGVS
jgi:D-glycero-D-manno-heptose 1,7-bisphosphate phosphatase